MATNKLFRDIRLTKEISLEDILDSKVSYVDAYKSQIAEWILKPCRMLSLPENNNSNFGVTILMLLLSFFEPHAQYLTGNDSNGRSKQFFKIGFKEFRDFLIRHQRVDKHIDTFDVDKLYEFVRCGLFHSCVMYKEFLIDSIDYSNNSISENPIHGGWLINVRILLDDLTRYVDFYIQQINEDDILKNNFEITFERLIVEPMKGYKNYV